MTLDDRELGEQLRDVQRHADGAAPEFGLVWTAAEARRKRRPVRIVAAAGCARRSDSDVIERIEA